MKCFATDECNSPSSFQYDVEWVLGGKLCGCDREDLIYRTADEEGMTDSSEHRRRKRKPVDFMEDVAKMEDAKKRFRQQQQKKQPNPKPTVKIAVSVPSNDTPTKIVDRKKGAASKSARKKAAPGKASSSSGIRKRVLYNGIKNEPSTLNGNKKSKESKNDVIVDDAGANSSSLDMFERHDREFNRFLARLREKVDLYRHFWSSSGNVPPEFNECYTGETEKYDSTSGDADVIPVGSEACSVEIQNDNIEPISGGPQKIAMVEACIFPPHPPYNWEMLERRLDHGRYIIDREYEEEEERFNLLESYYTSLPTEERPKRIFPSKRVGPSKSTTGVESEAQAKDSRVANAFGINWDLFRKDVIGMCDAAIDRADSDDDEDCGQRGSLSYTVKRIKEAVEQACERTGTRHYHEMRVADDRHRFANALENYENKEPAMQSWRDEPFPERKYERIDSDAVCSGLSKVDERIARYELRTNLPDSFMGQSYHYNDTSLSEVWMKSVVDETETIRVNKKEGNNKRAAALAMSADEGVTRAQVNATMQSLLVAVQDRVMTETKVLQQRELTSDNWLSSCVKQNSASEKRLVKGKENQSCEPALRCGLVGDDQEGQPKVPEIVEKPVWGIDCYTRRNICVCLELEFNSEIALGFIEKWLLPAINACPENLAQNIGNAARILEGLPFDYSHSTGADQDNSPVELPSMEEWKQNLLARAIMDKILYSAPPWLKAAANQLRRARDALGPNFFRVHPKGNGSVLLTQKVEANQLVTFYHGELYPSWRWGEKMDAIDITQSRKSLKP